MASVTPLAQRPFLAGLPQRVRARGWFGALCVALALGACKREPPPTDTASTAPVKPPEVPLSPKPSVESLSLLDRTDDCEFFHRGITLDLGYPALESRRHFSPERQGDVTWVSREGARFARLSAPKVTYDVWVDEPKKSLAVRARVHGAAGRMFSVYLDDVRLGTAKVQPDVTKIIEFPAREMEVARGRHRVTIAFSGRSGPRRPGPTSYGEISWLSLTEELPEKRSDTPTTRTDALVDVVLGERPRRSIALREESSIHCPIWVPPGAHLKVSLGLWGEGTGNAELVVARDEEQPISLGSYALQGGQGWKEIDLPLSQFEGQVVELELTANDLSESARMAFGEPRLERPRAVAKPAGEEGAQAKRAIVIVLGGLSRKHQPPESRASGLGFLGRFSEHSVSFTGYRTPTTVVSSVMASLLTGLSPRRHSLDEPTRRLPSDVPTIAAAVKAKSGRAAMFTAVPTTFPAFGLDRGFERFEQVSPVADRPATEPLQQAEQWLSAGSDSEGPGLVVVHLRGGHPPFDLALDRARELPPAEYGGDLDPRRAAIQLAQIRARPPRLRELLPEDATRLDAMQRVALEKQDAALTRFFRLLEEKELYDDSLIIVMGDVAAGEPPEVPFDPAGPLTEDRLRTLLFIKWPHGKWAGREASVPMTTTDLYATLAAALGLEPTEGSDGIDVRMLLDGPPPVSRGPLEATLASSYATRSAEWLLRGDFGQVPSLCRLASDPSCTTDLLERYPRVASAMWQWTHAIEQRARAGAPKPEAAEPDRATEAALTVWGDRF